MGGVASYLCIVIGAGQAGLATAQQLAHRGLVPGEDFLLIDANPGPGGAWRHRWDSLTLGKAHGIANLPGMAAPSGDHSTPASQVVAEYYKAYEDRFHLRPYRPARVRRVTQDGDFSVTLDSGEVLVASTIVNATGTWDRPYIPFIPGISSFGGRQLHTKDYSAAKNFSGQRVLVVGGGLSAVQFLVELEGIAHTTWATRRAPDFVRTNFDERWGRDVEDKVRSRVFGGQHPASVVSTTGIPPWQEYLDAVERGVLVSRGMFNAIDSTGVTFGAAPGLPADHPQPAAWQPLPAGTHVTADVIFWNTGFRPVLDHLAPLRLRSRHGGIALRNEVSPLANPRVFLAGYGSTASTVGATRAGRLAAREVIAALDL